MKIAENVSLKPYNSFNLEYEARYFIEVDSEEALSTALSHELVQQNQVLLLGGGSNILLTENYPGVVIKINLNGIEILAETDHDVVIKVGAGEIWHDLVLHCIKNNWAGVENLSLIPGTVGAAPMQNIGAYGVEIREVFDHLEAMEIASGNIHKFDNAACHFGYRESVFKKEFKGQYVITRVVLRLSKTPDFNITYGAIRDTLSEMGIEQLSLKSVSDAVIHIRQSKLPDPQEIGNAGSFFKNPVITDSVYQNLKEKFPAVPSYIQEDGSYKIPAAWLIDQAGWKGKIFGNIGVHKNQALVLVNYGNGDGRKLEQLSVDIRRSVKEKFGIDLSPEVNII